MKKLIPVLFLALALGCGNNPGPVGPPGPPGPPAPIPVPVPTPPPTPSPLETSFEVNGIKIYVKGEMKPAAKATIGEVRAAVLSAVAQLEPK